jgi:hypothetical protein
VRLFLILFFVLTHFISAEDEAVFLENGILKLGVNLSAGGSIFYFGRTRLNENVLNHYDRGRFIQQSYYGRVDGSKWDKKDWVWNPVQGGHYEGKGARVVEVKKSKEDIYLKSVPVHWATGEELDDCLMEQWIILKGQIVHVRYKFTYKGEEEHPVKSQEVPAVFVDSRFSRLVFYAGDSPWTNGEVDAVIPGWPNKSQKMTENWAAFIDEKDWGIGVFTPGTEDLTCYRYIVKNKSGSKSPDCSYFAPVRKMAIKKNTEVVYDVFLTLGKIGSIRQRFYEMKEYTIRDQSDKNEKD